MERCMCTMQAGTQMTKLKGKKKGLVRFFYLDEHKSCVRWRPSRKHDKAKSEPSSPWIQSWTSEYSFLGRMHLCGWTHDKIVDAVKSPSLIDKLDQSKIRRRINRLNRVFSQWGCSILLSFPLFRLSLHVNLILSFERHQRRGINKYSDPSARKYI